MELHRRPNEQGPRHTLACRPRAAHRTCRNPLEPLRHRPVRARRALHTRRAPARVYIHVVRQPDTRDRTAVPTLLVLDAIALDFGPRPLHLPNTPYIKQPGTRHKQSTVPTPSAHGPLKARGTDAPHNTTCSSNLLHNGRAPSTERLRRRVSQWPLSSEGSRYTARPNHRLHHLPSSRSPHAMKLLNA